MELPRRRIPRRRRTPIRLALVKREPRRRLRRRPPRANPIAELVPQLLSLPPVAELNLSALAVEMKVTVRYLRWLISRLERAGAVRRIDARGGRGRGLGLRINHIALAGVKLGKLPPSPFLKIRSGSASGGAGAPAARVEAAPPRLRTPNWPVDRTQLKTEFKRTQRCRDPVRRMAGWQRLVRRTCGVAGLKLAEAKRVAAAYCQVAAALGKAANREALLLAVIKRLLVYGEKPPLDWFELLRWVEHAQEAYWAAGRASTA